MSEPEGNLPVNTATTVKNLIVKRRKFLIVIAAFALLGGTLLTRSQAATYVVPLEAESGVTTGNVGPGQAQGASNNQSVAFGASGANPTPPPPGPTPPPAGNGNPTDPTCNGSAQSPTAPVAGYTLKKCEDFNSGLGQFKPYESGGGSTVVGPGRTAYKTQCLADGGMLRQLQRSDGGTCGGDMSGWSQKYGYYEARVKAFSTGGSGSAPHPVLIVWPDNDDGELDWFETSIGNDSYDVYMHCVGNNGSNCVAKEGLKLDLTQWHVIGFEWSPSGFKGYVDGKETWSAPPSGADMGSGNQTIQLDNLSGKTPVAPGEFDVDWIHMYQK